MQKAPRDIYQHSQPNRSLQWRYAPIPQSPCSTFVCVCIYKITFCNDAHKQRHNNNSIHALWVDLHCMRFAFTSGVLRRCTKTQHSQLILYNAAYSRCLFYQLHIYSVCTNRIHILCQIIEPRADSRTHACNCPSLTSVLVGLWGWEQVDGRPHAHQRDVGLALQNPF